MWMLCRPGGLVSSGPKARLKEEPLLSTLRWEPPQACPPGPSRPREGDTEPPLGEATGQPGLCFLFRPPGPGRAVSLRATEQDLEGGWRTHTQTRLMPPSLQLPAEHALGCPSPSTGGLQVQRRRFPSRVKKHQTTKITGNEHSSSDSGSAPGGERAPIRAGV